MLKNKEEYSIGFDPRKLIGATGHIIMRIENGKLLQIEGYLGDLKWQQPESSIQ